MKITYLKLENFAGIYAGTGLKKIEIDFKNNKNNIILFNGRNGSGKTIILSNLSPFRETNDDRKDIILEGEKGYKEIHFLFNKDKYIIKHFYGNTSSQNKSFISKNGKELNENGGVRTFNKIVEDELKVTQEYFRVGRLGNNVRNFIDLKTAERKKYINQFIPSIDDFLEAFEIVKEKFNDSNKRLKSLNMKLEKYDDFDILKNNKKEIEENLNKLNNKFEVIKKKKIENDIKINSIQERVEAEVSKLYDTMYENIDDYIFYLKHCKDNLNKSIARIGEDLEKYFSKSPKLRGIPIKTFEKNIIILQEKNNNLNKDLENNNENCKKIKLELNNLNNEKTDYENRIESFVNEDVEPYIVKKEELSNSIKNLNKKIKTNLSNLNKDENELWEELKVELSENYNNQISLFNDNISEKCSIIFNNYGQEDVILEIMNSNGFINIERVAEYLKNTSKYFDNLNNDLKQSLEIINGKLSYLERNKDLLKILDKKPEDCKNEDCEFIANALKFEKEYSLLDEITKEKEEVLNKIKENQEKINNNTFILRECEEIINIENFFIKNFHVYECNFNSIFNENFEINLLRSRFSFIEKLFNKIKFFNDLYIDYKNLENYEKELEYVNNRIKIIKDTDKIFYNLKEEEEKISDKIKLKENEIHEITNKEREFKSTINLNKIKIDTFKSISDLLDQKDKIENEIKILEEIINNVNNIKLESEDSLNDKVFLNEEMENLTNQIKTFKEKLDNINRDYIIVENTINELNNIKDNYDTLKLVKDSLDPKIGIPLIFIDNYLKDISQRTNELLQISSKEMFQIKFEITESDFFIKVYKNDGTFLKDINEASQGEVSLTNISLSLSMIEKMMSEYNILYLDEVDATLSTQNRRLFLDLVEKQIKELNIEQVFVISHNNEFYASNIDLILLDGNDVDKSDKDLMNNKNIIFDIDKK